MRKILTRSTALAAALACSSLAFAAAPPPATNASTGATASHPRHHHMHHHMHRHHQKNLLDQLNLTDSQRSSVHQLVKQSFDQARPEMQSLRQKRMAFENATPGSSGYQSAANDLAQAESNAAHARVLREADLRTKIYNLLTPAQRTQLASIRAQRQAKMKQWRESHMQRRSAGAPAAASTAQ